MNKLMKAVYNDYHAIPVKKVVPTPAQQEIIYKRSRFKTICRSVGISLFSCGGLLFYASKKEQEKFLCPWWNIKKIPPRLVTSGPYAYSRNPMYLAYIMMYASAGIFFLNWVFLSLPLFGVTGLAFNFYDKTYIPIEEDKLMRKFGEKFILYKAVTPKWIGLPKKISPQTPKHAEKHFHHV